MLDEDVGGSTLLSNIVGGGALLVNAQGGGASSSHVGLARAPTPE
jgi:hypothetical protein